MTPLLSSRGGGFQETLTLSGERGSHWTNSGAAPGTAICNYVSQKMLRRQSLANWVRAFKTSSSNYVELNLWFDLSCRVVVFDNIPESWPSNWELDWQDRKAPDRSEVSGFLMTDLLIFVQNINIYLPPSSVETIVLEDAGPGPILLKGLTMTSYLV